MSLKDVQNIFNIRNITVIEETKTLKALNLIFKNKYYLPVLTKPALDKLNIKVKNFDFSDIVSQGHAKRALEIAASGGHNIFTLGTLF